MKSEYLEYLIAIKDCRSISAAAQKLYLSQTTLSTTVKNIEEELGVMLFRRTKSGLELTSDGEEAMLLISEITQRIHKIHQLYDGAHSSFQSIPVLSSPTIFSGLALPLYEAVAEKDSNINLVFNAFSGEEIGTKLIKNEGRIGLTYFSQENMDNFCAIASKYQIKVEPLFMDQLYLLVSKDSPFASSSSVSFQSLENLHFASLPCYISSNSGLFAHPLFWGSGNYHTIFSDIALIKQAILNHGMVAMLSGYAIQYNHSCDNSKLKAIRLTGVQEENKMILCLIHRADRDLCYQEKLIIQCIKAYFSDLPQPPFAPKSLKIPKGK